MDVAPTRDDTYPSPQRQEVEGLVQSVVALLSPERTTLYIPSREGLMVIAANTEVVGGTRLLSLGAYRPRRVIENDEVAANAAVDEEWIRERTGIERRRFADADEDIAYMAIAAGRAALEAADMSPDLVELVVLASCTQRFPIPSSAPAIAHGLGISSPGAFDLNAVCAGFSYALASASALVRVGAARVALVVASERNSDWTHPGAADVYPIFGDGAGAALVGASETTGIGPVVWGSDGGRAGFIGLAGDPARIRMDGPLVFKWAVETMPRVAHEACARAGVGIDDIAWLVPHQANLRIVDLVAARLGFDLTRVTRDVIECGNTSAASIPMALCRLREERGATGDLALLLGFGAGLGFAGQVVALP